MLKWFSAVVAALVSAGSVRAAEEVAQDRYRAGQVWEYRTRPGDEASLLRIQAIEPGGATGTVFHLTIVGVRVTPGGPGVVIGHTPVSRATLDASVTRLSKSTTVFPSASEGIEEWRRAQGGVFTIPVADIVRVIVETMREGGAK